MVLHCLPLLKVFNGPEPKVVTTTDLWKMLVKMLRMAVYALSRHSTEDFWMRFWTSWSTIEFSNFIRLMFERTQKNYELWKHASSLEVRIHLLNKLIINHLIGVLKQMNWRWPAGSITAQLDLLHRMDPIKHKGIELEIFEVTFSTNVDLPIGLAIGKGVSHGFGIITAEK